MARVTVEDCIEKISNRFELVMMASQRARKIGSGAALTVDRDNDKKTIISLREIAGGTIETDALKEEMIKSYQRYLPQYPEEEAIDLMDGEKEWGEMQQNSAVSGMYSDEEIGNNNTDDGNSSEIPSLENIAGETSES